MENTIKVRLKHRTATAAEWAESNPVLLLGEIGYESDTGYFKFGDGVSSWNSLKYTQYTFNELNVISSEEIDNIIK